MREMENDNRNGFESVWDFLAQTIAEVRIISPEQPPKIFYVKSHEEFAKVCHEWNGKGQVYVSINERDGLGGSRENVTALCNVMVDIDAMRPNHTREGATETELEEARRVAKRIVRWYSENGFREPLWIGSGNGVQLWSAVPKTLITNENRDSIEDKVEAFQRLVRDKFETGVVAIDNIGDLPRVIGVPFTENRKPIVTPDRPARIRMPLGGAMPQRVEDAKLLEYIMNLELDRTKLLPTAIIPSRLPKVLERVCPARRRLWEQGADEGKRSHAIAFLMWDMAYAGMSRDEIFEALMEHDVRTGMHKFVDRRNPAEYLQTSWENASRIENFGRRPVTCAKYHENGFCSEPTSENCPFERGQEKVFCWHGSVDTENDFVYEPLGDGLYVWRRGDRRGTSKVEAIHRLDKHGKETDDVLYYEIVIGGERIRLPETPPGVVKTFLEKPPFRLPTGQTVEAWVRGERKSLPITSIVQAIDKYVSMVLDLEEVFEVKIVTLQEMQTWLRKVMDDASNLDFGGPFGAGKTTALMALAEICYHPVLGTMSPATLARMSESYDLTWLIDEYDKAREYDEGILDMLIRQGDKRGLRVYRFNPETGRYECFDPFGHKFISYHTQLETALKQRSLYHIKMSISLDHRLPIINRFRTNYSQPLFDELFLWYLDNITKATLPELPELPDSGGYLAHLLSDTDYTGLRQHVYDAATASFTHEEKELLKKLVGRGGEKAYLAIVTAKAIGLQDYIDSLRKALEIKILEEQEAEDYEPEEIVKDVLSKMFSEKKGEAGDQPIELLQAEVYKQSKKVAKEEWGHDLKPNKFGRILRDVGFREKKNIKRKWGGARILVIDSSIQKKLNPSEKEERKTPGPGDIKSYAQFVMSSRDYRRFVSATKVLDRLTYPPKSGNSGNSSNVRDYRRITKKRARTRMGEGNG